MKFHKADAEVYCHMFNSLDAAGGEVTVNFVEGQGATDPTPGSEKLCILKDLSAMDWEGNRWLW